MEKVIKATSVSRDGMVVKLTIKTEPSMQFCPVFEFGCGSNLYAELLQKSIERGLQKHSDEIDVAAAHAYEQGYLQGWDDHRKKNRKAY